ncbi:hypothetical protein FEDK69T_30200 [Flavobacterium enshiense DK69]|uniref:Uncharacterized protein n=1 Tax=Flavobacterium enshiense DK69 TaxID=1107311 RepID=V6S0G7_9FLAO|nr:hypothetical protein [Flavobacterium enshiense]ESU20206.1 hypothetical protein FEDK69T_30200 [Flavobacterium enshiense DK69]KGO92016.1 hypothetical protein Q767_15805 [Flavobacterium enshiense DK69]
MKKILKCIIPILIITTLLSFKYGQNSVKIYGQLKPKKSETNIYGLKIFAKTNNTILAETFTDNFGKFKLTLIPEPTGKIDFFCTGIKNDTIFLKRIVNIKTDSLKLTFSLPIEYKLNSNGKIICPICKKANKVLKLFYLNTNPVSATGIKTTDKGKLITENAILKQEEYIPIELSRYSCERDKIKF